ncbi:MAG TPA: C45 family autoproteolytic acyltransferase/hydrolase [Spirochaetota bacterium]|nr:C45 family autoproteolytic acyltransferase/hydrolase [Spirochaetota bacterium]HPI89566.1 C45 family autoproteolytic acyltransferase/hydrolase [Spirochaetota bacterium]HPR49030.1 C45 family autoproteolytic acyltransferase/hydrolase [Spirochaetota bacterium]
MNFLLRAKNFVSIIIIISGMSFIMLFLFSCDNIESPAQDTIIGGTETGEITGDSDSGRPVTDSDDYEDDEDTEIVYAPGERCYKKQIGPDKYLMHLEGSPYEMGFAHGYLNPVAVQRMCSKEFYLGAIKGLISSGNIGALDQIFENDTLVDAVVKGVQKLALLHKDNIPEELMDEMQGIADGVNAAGEHSFSLDNVIMLNIAMDTLMSIVYPIIVPILPVADLLTAATPHACNAFIAFGDATTDGRVIMGRDFMFTHEVVHEVAMLIEYVPDNGYSFVSVNAPGFVGVTAAMNSEGIGIGMDVDTGIDTDPYDPGMGCLLLARMTIQYSDEMSTAIGIIKKAERGAPWIYAIGDGRGTEVGGAIIECSASRFAVRYADFSYPYLFRQLGYATQIEDKDDLVAATNHFITPWMQTTVLQYPSRDSLWRYKTMVNLIVDSYGTIDTAKGRELIDFLHPPNYDYYGDDPDRPVASSVNLFDLEELTVWSLFGLYSNPWASHQL